jgi:hypothetical protein
LPGLAQSTAGFSTGRALIPRYARMMDHVVQVVGALLILAAYAAAQFGASNQHSHTYLALNLVGSAVLAVLAWLETLRIDVSVAAQVEVLKA